MPAKRWTSYVKFKASKVLDSGSLRISSFKKYSAINAVPGLDSSIGKNPNFGHSVSIT